MFALQTNITSMIRDRIKIRVQSFAYVNANTHTAHAITPSDEIVIRREDVSTFLRLAVLLILKRESFQINYPARVIALPPRGYTKKMK